MSVPADRSKKIDLIDKQQLTNIIDFLNAETSFLPILTNEKANIEIKIKKLVNLLGNKLIW